IRPKSPLPGGAGDAPQAGPDCSKGGELYSRGEPSTPILVASTSHGTFVCRSRLGLGLRNVRLAHACVSHVSALCRLDEMDGTHGAFPADATDDFRCVLRQCGRPGTGGPRCGLSPPPEVSVPRGPDIHIRLAEAPGGGACGCAGCTIRDPEPDETPGWF